MRAETTRRRPASVSWRRMRPGTTPRSTLPPDSTTHVVPVAGGVTSPACTAATPTAPAPSTYSLARSISITMASAMASSSTATISSTQCSTSGPVSSPRCLTAMPSASVTTGPEAGASPRYGAHTAAWTPITLHRGQQRLDGDRHARRQSATSQRHDDTAQVGDVLDQLEAEGALPRDDCRVVEGVAERHAVLGRPAGAPRRRPRPVRRRPRRRGRRRTGRPRSW